MNEEINIQVQAVQNPQNSSRFYLVATHIPGIEKKFMVILKMP